MTTDLEKQFFDTFGIEPKILNGCKFERCLNINKGVFNCIKEKCPHYYKDKVVYPQITDRILLELICVRNSLLSRTFDVRADYLESLRIEILNRLLMDYKSCVQSFAKIGRERGYEFKHQVRTLFEEGK